MNHEFMRIPRVQRLEYLKAFLTSFSDGNLDEEQARKAIQREMVYFEVEKAKALGRKRPREAKGTSTLPECLKMARHLALIDRFHRLTADAACVLDTTQSRAFLLGRMWQCYPRFRQLVLLVRDSGQLDLPFYARGDAFRQEMRSQDGLELDHLTVQTVRDLATQLELVNWYPTENRRQIIYPAACVASFAEIVALVGLPVIAETYAQQCCHHCGLDLNLLTIRDDHYELSGGIALGSSGYLIIDAGSDQVFVKDHEVTREGFEQTLWKEYLGLSDMRPYFPVLYPNLRNRVCATLRISDRIFDRLLLSLIQEPQRLIIYPSGGVLNYAANLAHLGKFLHPKTSQGNFIVYLKMDRKGAT